MSSSNSSALSSPTPESDEGSVETVSPPSPPRPTRSEYADYAALLRQQRAHDPARLARRLVTRYRRAVMGGGEQDDTASGTVAPDRSTLAAEGTSLPQPLRSRKRRRGIQKDTSGDVSARWPLMVEETPHPPSTIQESVLAFASAYVRQHRLSVRQDSILRHPSDTDEPTFHANLVPSTIEVIDRVLVSLAGTRPVGKKRARKDMGCMDWQSVLAASSVLPGCQALTSAANQRARRVMGSDSPDILTHRLNLMSNATAHRDDPQSLINSLYASAIKTQDRATRPHQSKKELDLRQAKREQKEALRHQKKLEKEQRKEASKTRRRRRPRPEEDVA